MKKELTIKGDSSVKSFIFEGGGRPDNPNIYSVDLSIYGYSKDELRRAKAYLDQCLIGIWKTPRGQAILKNENIEQSDYQFLIKENNNIGPILLPPITLIDKPPVGYGVYSPIFRGDVNIDTRGRKNMEALMQDSYYEHELPGGNWVSEAVTVDNFLSNCDGIEEVDLNLKSATSIFMFASKCSSLKKVKLVLDSITYIGTVFSSCEKLEIIHFIAPRLNSLSTFSNSSLPSIKKIILEVSPRVSSISFDIDKYVANWTFLLIKSLTSNTTASINFRGCTSWGTGSQENRQSLIDTLITYSYDRIANGLNPVTIQLSAATIELLTDEEIATINNKGYTLAS